MSTNPTPAAKPTPAKTLAELNAAFQYWLVGLRCQEQHELADFLVALTDTQAATIRELSEQLQNARNLGLEWCNDANGHIALCGDQLNAALSRTPGAP